MRIINKETSDYFDSVNTYILIGYVAGPVRMFIASIQLLLNTLIFLISPLAFLFKKDGFDKTATQAAEHACESSWQILYGFIDFLPGSTFYSAKIRFFFHKKVVDLNS